MSIPQTKELIALERQWIASFIKHGLPFIGACAATGNITQENLGHPVTVGKLDHDSQGGPQYRLDRLDSTNAKPRRIPGPYGLKDWCAAHGLDWMQIDSQTQFLVWECHQFYGELFSELTQGTRPLDNLTANFMQYYEIPAKKSAALDNRIDAAQFCFENFKDLDPARAPPPFAVAPVPKEPHVPPTPPSIYPGEIVKGSIADLMQQWRAAKTALDAAQKAVNDTRAAVDAELARLENEVANSKKELT